MVDSPKRPFGPGFVYGGSGRTLYTVPTTPATTAFVRDITMCNSSSTAASIGRLAIGDPTNAANRLINQSVAASSTYSARGLWIMNGGETLQAQQATIGATLTGAVINTTAAGAAATNVSPAWTPAANTQYWLAVSNVKADAPNAVTMSGNGSWTQVATATTGSVAANNDVRTTLFQWYSSSAGSSATTTASFGGAAQVESLMVIMSMTNIPSTAPSPYTLTPSIQTATANDSAAPSTTTAGLPLTFGSTMTSGIPLFVQARVDGGGSATPPTGYTEISDAVGVTTLGQHVGIITAPSTSSTTVLANVWGSSTTTLRAAVACEVTPDLATYGMSFTVSVIEVTL